MQLNAGPAPTSNFIPSRLLLIITAASRAIGPTRRVITMDSQPVLLGLRAMAIICSSALAILARKASRASERRRNPLAEGQAKRKLIILIYNTPVIIYNLLRPKEEELAIPFKASFVPFGCLSPFVRQMAALLVHSEKMGSLKFYKLLTKPKCLKTILLGLQEYLRRTLDLDCCRKNI